MGDEVDRLQQSHRVAEVGQPSGVAVRHVHEDQVSLGGNADGATGLAIAGGDVHDMVTVRPGPVLISDRRVVTELLIRP